MSKRSPSLQYKQTQPLQYWLKLNRDKCFYLMVATCCKLIKHIQIQAIDFSPLCHNISVRLWIFFRMPKMVQFWDGGACMLPNIFLKLSHTSKMFFCRWSLHTSEAGLKTEVGIWCDSTNTTIRISLLEHYERFRAPHDVTWGFFLSMSSALLLICLFRFVPPHFVVGTVARR